MRGVLGLCDDETRTITLDAREPRVQRELTLVHEVLHALFPSGIVDGETEERIVRGMEAPTRALLMSGALVAVPDEVP
jgi:Zn-dependent peptidase ImmA (M78 family)